MPEELKTTISHALGEIVWLLSQSPIYKRMAIGDLEWMVMPPMMHNQFRIFKNGKQPVGLALWAYLSEAAEERMLAQNKKGTQFQLKPEEWKSGDRLWLVELVCPFANAENKLTEHLLNDLTQHVFKDQKFKFITYSADGKRRKMESKS